MVLIYLVKGFGLMYLSRWWGYGKPVGRWPNACFYVLHLAVSNQPSLYCSRQKVVFIGLFWFCFVSFSYTGVYFLRFFFNALSIKIKGTLINQHFQALKMFRPPFRCCKHLKDGRNTRQMSLTESFNTL